MGDRLFRIGPARGGAMAPSPGRHSCTKLGRSRKARGTTLGAPERRIGEQVRICLDRLPPEHGFRTLERPANLGTLRRAAQILFWLVSGI